MRSNIKAGQRTIFIILITTNGDSEIAFMSSVDNTIIIITHDLVDVDTHHTHKRALRPNRIILLHTHTHTLMMVNTERTSRRALARNDDTLLAAYEYILPFR